MWHGVPPVPGRPPAAAIRNTTSSKRPLNQTCHFRVGAAMEERKVEGRKSMVPVRPKAAGVNFEYQGRKQPFLDTRHLTPSSPTFPRISRRITKALVQDLVIQHHLKAVLERLDALGAFQFRVDPCQGRIAQAFARV